MPTTLLVPETRDCVDCQQCCIIYKIDGIDKKARENCPFLNAGVGCKDYDNRPIDCRNFECTWINGYGAEEDNPNICGVLIMKRRSNLMHEGKRLLYIASEVWEGAFKSKEGFSAMSRFCEETDQTIIMMDFTNQRIVSLCIGGDE